MGHTLCLVRTTVIHLEYNIIWLSGISHVIPISGIPCVIPDTLPLFLATLRQKITTTTPCICHACMVEATVFVTYKIFCE